MEHLRISKMANVYAIQNGNWNDGSTWNTGTVPTANDDVWLNGKTINVTTNIYAKSINNNDNGGDYSAGGNLNVTQDDIVVTSDLNGFGNSNFIKVLSNQRITFIGNIQCKMSPNINFIQGVSTGLKRINVNGDISISDGGTFIYNSGQYTYLTINGNTTISQSVFTNDTYRNYLINGNITADCTINLNWSGFGTQKCTYNGNLYLSGGSILFGSTNVFGTVYVTGNAILNISGSDTYINNIEYDNFYVNMTLLESFNGATIGGLYNYSNASAFTSVDLRNSSITFTSGEIHLGNITALSLTLSYATLINNLYLRESVKIFYKTENFLMFGNYITTDGSNVQYIYEGEGQPTFQIVRYAQQLNYPTEQQVAQGVTYGMQNEYEGELQLPPESVVLKDYQYSDKTGTLEVSGADENTLLKIFKKALIWFENRHEKHLKIT